MSIEQKQEIAKGKPNPPKQEIPDYPKFHETNYLSDSDDSIEKSRKPHHHDSSIEGMKVALNIMLLLNGKSKAVKRAAMRAVASQLDGEFTLKSEVKRTAIPPSQLFAKINEKRVHEKEQAPKHNVQPQKALWKENPKWEEILKRKASCLDNLKKYDSADTSIEAGNARLAYSNAIAEEKRLKGILKK